MTHGLLGPELWRYSSLLEQPDGNVRARFQQAHIDGHKVWPIRRHLRPPKQVAVLGGSSDGWRSVRMAAAPQLKEEVGGGEIATATGAHPLLRGNHERLRGACRGRTHTIKIDVKGSASKPRSAKPPPGPEARPSESPPGPEARPSDSAPAPQPPPPAAKPVANVVVVEVPAVYAPTAPEMPVTPPPRAMPHPAHADTLTETLSSPHTNIPVNTQKKIYPKPPSLFLISYLFMRA